MGSFNGQNPNLLLLATCDKILSWMIEIWMENHLVSDSNCNAVNLQSPINLPRMTVNVGLPFSVGDTIPRFTISMDQDN
jgi:hypothetical protein